MLKEIILIVIPIFRYKFLFLLLTITSFNSRLRYIVGILFSFAHSTVVIIPPDCFRYFSILFFLYSSHPPPLLRLHLHYTIFKCKRSITFLSFIPHLLPHKSRLPYHLCYAVLLLFLPNLLYRPLFILIFKFIIFFFIFIIIIIFLLFLVDFKTISCSNYCKNDDSAKIYEPLPLPSSFFRLFFFYFAFRYRFFHFFDFFFRVFLLLYHIQKIIFRYFSQSITFSTLLIVIDD